MELSYRAEDRELMGQITRDPRYRELSDIPLLAVPTLTVLAGGYALYAGSVLAGLNGLLPYALALPLAAFGVFWTFTPLHDAVHRSASRHHALNEVIGFLGAFLLLPGITARIYRYLHLEHHKHTGDDARDPDEVFVAAKGIYAPLAWIGIDVIWTLFYLKNVRSRPATEVFEFFAGLTFYVAVHIAFLTSPYATEFLLYYVLPQRLGIGIVVYFFAHIQHPEGILQREHPFQGTVMIQGGPLVRLYLLGQNNHLMHHLFPALPWYRYRDVYRLGRHVFDAQGLVHRPLFGRCRPITVEPHTGGPIRARVVSVENGGGTVKVFTLVPAAGKFPRFSAGSHIDVFLTRDDGSTCVRQYSLLNAPSEGDRYRIGVQREAQGRGGSRLLHATLTVGAEVMIGAPRNHFPLADEDREAVLIGAGIGITPLLAMAHALGATATPFELHHARRNEEGPDAALMGGESIPVTVHVDRDGGSTLPIAEVLGAYRPGRRVYLCGPAGFMSWVLTEAERLGWPPGAVRTESFTPTADERPPRAFEVYLQRSRKTLKVREDQTLLQVLEDARAGLPSNCTAGLCGACVCGVLEGEVEHRDSILTAAEKAQNAVMYPCVSRAAGARITLDL